MYTYKTHGTCSRAIHIELDGDVITHVDFVGGCDGNLQAIPKLVQGKTVDEVIEMLEGIRCGYKPTSCPDQLARGLREARRAT